MELQEIVRVSNKTGGYIVAVINQRDLQGRPTVCEMIAECDTYEEARAGKSLLQADGVEDVMICPPYLSKEIEPKEMADFWRSVLDTQVEEAVPKITWLLEM